MSLPPLREKLLSLCGIQIACHIGQKIPQYSIHGASSGYCVPSFNQCSGKQFISGFIRQL